MILASLGLELSGILPTAPTKLEKSQSISRRRISAETFRIKATLHRRPLFGGLKRSYAMAWLLRVPRTRFGPRMFVAEPETLGSGLAPIPVTRAKNQRGGRVRIDG